MAEILKHDVFTCHKKRHLQCAGHMLIKGEENTFVQLAHRLGFPLELSGRELIFDTKEQCLEHHRDTTFAGALKKPDNTEASHA